MEMDNKNFDSWHVNTRFGSWYEEFKEVFRALASETEKQKCEEEIATIYKGLMLSQFPAKTWKQIVSDIKFFDFDFNDAYLYVDAVSYLVYHGYSYQRIREILKCETFWSSRIRKNKLLREDIEKYLRKWSLYCHYVSFRTKWEKNELPELFGSFLNIKYPRIIDEEKIQKIEALIEAQDSSINKKILETTQKYSFVERNIDDFVFQLPRSYREIVEEATAMRNCIAARYQQYMKEELLFIFMRNKDNPNKPFADVIIDTKGMSVIWAIAEGHRDIEGEKRILVDKYIDIIKQETKRAIH